ncbi:MAG: hypothetical protein ACYC3A_11885 [Halothiobacillus sp.]
MSWTSAIRYTKKLFEAGQPDESAADSTAPLHARINGIIEMQQTPLIRAMAAGSLFDLSIAPQNTILGISHITLDMTGDLWRLYTELGDVLNTDDRFVQLYTGEDGNLIEALACTRLTGFVPTPDEIDAFQGEQGFGLGEQTYTLWRPQLNALGLSDTQLQPIMGDSDRIEYHRDPDPALPFLPPFKGRETEIEDAAGTRGRASDVWFMPYVRTLTDGSLEYLLIQLSVINSRNGNNDDRAVLVELWIGIPVEKERISIR